MKDRKILFAAFAIFLLMGAAPLHAARVHGAEEIAQQQALGNQQKEEIQGKFPLFGASCDTLQENFLRLNSETSASLSAISNGESLSFTAQVALAMKVRGMLRAARRAASNECAWLSDTEVVDFNARIAEIAQMSPCAATAQQILADAENLDDDEQEVAMRQALQVFMSPTCEVPEDDDDDEADDADIGDAEEDDNDAEVFDDSDGADGDLDDELGELNAEATQEEDEIMEEVDELADELTITALADPSGASLVQESQDPLSAIIGGAFIALFFGLFFLLWLPFIVGAACFTTGLGFLVFSLVGCMLFNLLQLLIGRVPNGCPMFNWLPYCPAAFAGVITAIWGNNVRVGRRYNSGYYNTGYVGGAYGPGYVAPVVGVAPVVTTQVYYDRRRRFFGGGRVRAANRRANRRVRRANRRARRANRRANRRVRRANRRARRMR